MILAAIPAFNEERTIAKVIARAKRHADQLLVIDDGSTDDTALIAESMGARVVRHPSNEGYGASIQSCFGEARGMNADVLVILDADGQHNPDDIPQLTSPVRAGKADVVVGTRLAGGVRSAIPNYRLAGMKLLNEATSRLANERISDSQSGFRAYSRKAIEEIRIYEQGMGATSEIHVRGADVGLRLVEIPVDMAYSGLDTSSQHPLTHGLEVLSALLRIAGERHPVLLFGLPGFLSVLGGLVGWVWTANRFAQVQELPLGTALLSTIFLIGGVVAINTAIILYTIANVSRRLRQA